jgi:hypothetical protein
MKRNLLLLAVMILTVYLYSVGLAQCPQDPNDNGLCDTLYMEVWAGDANNLIFNPPGPDHALIPLYITNDISGVIDSIAGTVIPLCYYKATNATKYCSLSTYWNTTTLAGASFARSIFRTLGSEMTWMKEYYDDPDGPYNWANVILQLDGTSHFWLMMAPTTQPDYIGGHHDYTVVMDFKLEDSMTICIDTCFWPPSNRLAFSRKDAVTYIPRMSWKNPQGEGEFCHSFYIVPNEKPYFSTCPPNESQHTVGSFSGLAFVAKDDDGTVNLVTAVGAGSLDIIVDGITFDPGYAPPAAEVRGVINYRVINHCPTRILTVCLTATDDQGAVNEIACCPEIYTLNGDPTIEAGASKEGPYNVQLCGDDIVTGDPDGDVVTWSITGVNPDPAPGTFSIVGNKVCFNATCDNVSITYTVTVTAEDVCDATAEDMVTFHVTNTAPTCEFVGAPTQLTTGDVVTVDFTYDDDEGAGTVTGFAVNTNSCGTAGPVTAVGGIGSFEYEAPDAEATCHVCLTVTDECGLEHECCFDVVIVATRSGLVKIPNRVYERFGFGHWDYICNQDPEACDNLITMDDACPPWNGINPGDFFEIPILFTDPLNPDHPGIGGFELEVEFDYLNLTFYGAARGGLLEGRYWTGEPFGDTSIFWSWEYFSYRVLPCPLCACCKYKILLFGQSDMPDGEYRKGYCLSSTPDSDPATFWYDDWTTDDPPVKIGGVLAWLKFQVANNELLRDLKLPIVFEWEHKLSANPPYVIIQDWDCAENTMSSCDGAILFVSDNTMQYDPTICPAGVSDLLHFVDGGVHICSPCTSFTCVRGDINMDGVAYSVADAVLFARYFAEGIGVFIVDRDEQVCATDVNADGRTLMLSDLIYLIRVILHDAVEFPKLTPSSEVVNVIVSNNVITTECASSIGAVLFEFDGAVSPTLLATNMEIVAGTNKVLVYMNPITGASLEGTTEVLSAGSKLLSVTAVDRDGRDLKTTITAKAAPTAFALNPAYPNPFNPYTNLSFILPEAISYSLSVYNVAGQLVRSYEGLGQVGMNMITWDGKDNSGVSVASGVYFYKLTAGKYSATEKMVMMK